MAISATSSQSVAAAQANATVKARDTLSSNYETFLKLLTTQLQNQDPLAPTDATKFTEQLVSYSQVEQQIQTNTNLNAMMSMMKAAAGANAVSYLGKTATTSGPVSSLSGGSAKWNYTLPQDAATIQVNVTDGRGTIIRTLQGDKTTGMHEISWDGKNGNGAQMPEGQYTLAVVARKADGSAVNATVTGLGQVRELDMSSLEPMVTIGTRKIKLSEITGLRN